MKRFCNLAAIAAASMTALLLATPAAAQATRTWVSGIGDDANPCSRTAPCKTFAGAIIKTATSGEIDCLDPGGFGMVTITKPITVDCSAAGHLGGVLVEATDGIDVNPGAGNYVQLINLYLDGYNNTGLNGVRVESGNVLIANSYIVGFSQGANCNTAINNGTAAVCVNGPAGTKVTIENSILRNNGMGVINNPSAGANTVVIEHSVIDSNITTNVENTGAGAKTYLNGDSLINCPIATASTGGTFFTYGNNVITGTVAPMTTNPFQ